MPAIVQQMYDIFRFVQALTILDDLGNEDDQLYNRQDIYNPSDLPLEPSILSRRPPCLSSRICVSYEQVVLFMWENRRYCMCRVVLRLATVQRNGVSIIEWVRIIM